MSAVATFPPLTSLAEGLRPRDLAELRGFVGIAEAQPSDGFKATDLFQKISQAVEALALSVLEKRTEDEFRAALMSAFNDYARLLRARSDLIQVLLKGDRLAEHFVLQGINELENEVKSGGVAQFGHSITEQAIFTTWTLRKTASLLWTIQDCKEPTGAEAKQDLLKLASQFAFYLIWAQFHLECLVTSMRRSKPIYPAIHDAMLDGLRAEVNAYAVARQIADVLSPRAEFEDIPYEWDEEDKELLASSMEDIEVGL